MPIWNGFSSEISSVFIDYLNKLFTGLYGGGANSSKKEDGEMIILPITQLQMILSMIIAEVFLLSDPSYTVRIGSENYFSLAVGAFFGSIFIFAIIAIKFGSTIRFKEIPSKEKITVKVRQG